MSFHRALYSPATEVDCVDIRVDDLDKLLLGGGDRINFANF